MNKILSVTTTQVYNTWSTIYIALCPHHPRSSLLLSPCTWPPFPSSTFPSLLPSGNYHTFGSIGVLGCLFVCVLCFLLSVLYPTYKLNHMVLVLFCIRHFLYLMTLTVLKSTGQLFYRRLSTRVCPMFFSWLEWGYGFWRGRAQRENALLMTPYQGHVLSTWLMSLFFPGSISNWLYLPNPCPKHKGICLQFSPIFLQFSQGVPRRVPEDKTMKMWLPSIPKVRLTGVFKSQMVCIQPPAIQESYY